MKKNNTAQKTALEAEQISKALKEGTEKTLQSLIKEAISDMMDDTDDTEDEPIEDDSFDVEDVETDETPTDGTDEEPETDDVDGGVEDEPADTGDEADDEWSDMEDYKVGDNDYDFTGVDGEMAIKVYNRLGDDDQIFVKKEDDGTYSVKDDESGAEFVIELEPDGDEDADADLDTDDEGFSVDGNDEEEFDIDLDSDSDMTDGENPDAEEGDEEEFDIDLDSDDENPDEIDVDDDDEELNEEKQEWTDNYQSKDPIDGLTMTEPANKKATYSMDGGVPQDTKKPWAGKGKSDPFDKTVKEGCQEGKCKVCGKEQGKCSCQLDENGSGKNSKRRMTKGMTGINNQGQGYHEESKGKIEESKVRKIVEAAKAIQAENKQYQEVIGKIKQSLYEAAVLNMNYGKIVNLLVNETTTKAEKQSIVERFNTVKTINEGKQLYDTIKRELNESNKKTTPLIDEQVSANSSKTINETTIFQQTSLNNPSISLMERMDNLFTKKKH